MRITFVLAQADLSGGVRMVASYAQHLLQRGHEVLVISRPPRPATLREHLRRAIKGRPLPTVTRGGPSHLDNSGVPHRVLESHRPVIAADLPDADVVVATWWETARWVHALPPSKGAKAYFIQGYEIRPDLPPELLDITWRQPMHKIVIARWLAELSKQRFGDADYSLVPNAVDVNVHTVPPRGKQATPKVGMLYSQVACKACEVALAAYELARKRVPELKLVAFAARAPAPEMPLPSGAEFYLQPPQPKIVEIYASADAWLFSSRQEGFGLPLLEAMASRTPVIATPAGAAPELLAEGGGLAVPVDDPKAMADAIVSIAQMPEPAWRTLSDKAFATASRYNWEHSTDLFEAALHRAVEKASNAAFSRT